MYSKHDPRASGVMEGEKKVILLHSNSTYSLGTMTAYPPPGIIREALEDPPVTGWRKHLGIPAGFFTLWKSNVGSPLVGHCCI